MADRPEHSAEDKSASDAAPVGALVAIDACRPGSDDLTREFSTELAGDIRGDERLVARYRAVQRLDHAIADAFDQVPLPAGLESRLLAAVASQQAELDAERLAASPTAAPLEPARDATPVRVHDDARTSRRRWLQLCGGALASTAAGVGFLWWRSSSELANLTLEETLDRALEFNKSPEARLAEAIPVTREPAPAEFPWSRRLVGLCGVPRWRRVDGRLLGRDGVAYELSSEDQLATLYVLASDGRRGSASIQSLPDQPEKLISTGGYTAAGWREDDRIQLLVVHGDDAFLRSFLTTPGLVT